MLSTVISDFSAKDGSMGFINGYICAVICPKTCSIYVVDGYFLFLLIMWVRCRFLDKEFDGSNPPASVCCLLEQDTLSALVELYQL